MNRIRITTGVIPVIVFLGLWEILARTAFPPGQGLLPPFTSVLAELFSLISSGVLADSFVRSLSRVLIGFVTGSCAGLLVGVLLGWSTHLDKTFRPIISLLYPIPALGWLPLFMLWIGINELLPIAIIFICSFFPVCYSTASGVKSVPHEQVWAARTLGATDIRILRTIVIPLALPSIFTGLRIEAGMAWRVVIAAEMVAIPTGIGALMMRAESLLKVDVIVVCLMVLSLMCFCFEKVLLLMEKRLTAAWLNNAEH